MSTRRGVGHRPCLPPLSAHRQPDRRAKTRERDQPAGPYEAELLVADRQFDEQTPGANNDAANGQPFGPPAPPRDGRSDIGDLTQCFNCG